MKPYAAQVQQAYEEQLGRANRAEAEVERLRGLVEIIASNLDSVMPDSAATIRAALREEAVSA